MKQLELQKPISQLFNSLKSQFCVYEQFSDRCSEQLKKSHNFSKTLLRTLNASSQENIAERLTM